MNRILRKKGFRNKSNGLSCPPIPFFLGCSRQRKKEALILAAASSLDMIYITMCQN